MQQAPGLARELRRVKRAMRRAEPTLPWRLQLLLTFSCGSRCKTCLIWSRYEREPERRLDEMSPDAFGRLVGSVGKHLRWLSFTGGEITDREDVHEVFRQCADAAPNARVLSSSSHGLAPEKLEALFSEIAGRYPDRAVMVTISLDGLGETYERIRGVDGAERARESLARLQRLSARYPNLSASFQATLSRRNLDQVAELVEAMNEAAAGNVITLANDSRVLTEGRIKAIDVREQAGLDAALSAAIRATRANRVSSVFSIAFMRLVQRALAGDGQSPIPCAAGFASLTITPYGEVLQCDRHDDPLGWLTAPDYDLAAVIRSEDYARRLAPVARCRECFTPCLAYPSMMQAPLQAALGAALGKLGTSSGT